MRTIIRKLLIEDYLQSVRSYYLQRAGSAVYKIDLYSIALDIIGFPADDTDMRSLCSSEFFQLIQRQVRINSLAGIFEPNSSVETAVDMHIDWLYTQYAEWQGESGRAASV